MVQPVPSHPDPLALSASTPLTSSPAPVAEPPSAGAPREARPPPWRSPSAALCHGRTTGPTRDRLVTLREAARPVQLPRTGSAGAASTARAASSAGYAGAVATAVVSAVGSAVKATATTKKTTTSSAKKKSTGALAFLDDKSLSTDEKLMRLLVYLEGKWQKDVEKRLKEIAATGARKSSSSSSSGGGSSKGGGLLGSVVKAAATFVPGASQGLALLADPQARSVVSQLSGPVLAAGVTAAGFPELAPVALTVGPKAVNALASVAREASGSASSSSSSSSGSSSGTSYGDLSPDAAEKVQLMELQRVMEHQKELFSMVSNMLRSGHDLRMNVIQNLR